MVIQVIFSLVIRKRKKMNSLHFHREIDFDVLKATPEAVLIKVNKVKSSKFNRFTNLKRIQKVIRPLEIWIPKSWVKKDRWVSYVGCPGNMEVEHERFWVWEEGFLKNVEKLCKKREANEEDLVDKNFF